MRRQLRLCQGRKRPLPTRIFERGEPQFLSLSLSAMRPSGFPTPS